MGRYDQNIKVYEKWLKEGRGQGRHRDYKPWLHVYNVPSSGRSHRVLSHTASRVVHCLSDLEFSVFLLLEWSESVIDIREQFPLHPDSTIQHAKILGFRHPTIRGQQMVMTTDFLASTSNPRMPLLATQVKPSSELLKRRVREILAIEEANWNGIDVPFEIITEKSLDMVRVENIRWLSPYFHINAAHENLYEVAAFWENVLQQNQEWNLIKLAAEIDRQRNTSGGIALSELRKLFAKRLASFNMSIPFFKNLAGEVVFNASNAVEKWG